MMKERLNVARFFGEQVYGRPFADLTYEEHVALTKEYLLYLVAEVTEVLGDLDWKAHRLPEGRLNRKNLLEELVDVYKFWLGACVVWGFTDAEIAEMFWLKSDVVQQRFVQERELRLTIKPIAVVDIDGVLADYPASFLRFVGVRTAGTPPGVILDGRQLARLKHEYRDEGMEGAGVEPRPDAAEFMRTLHHAEDFFLIALTSRPYSRYKRLFGDTLRWFREYHIPVDFIAFEEDKAAFILRLLDQGKNVRLVIDDDARYVDKIRGLGVQAYLHGTGDSLAQLQDKIVGGVRD